MKRKEFSQKSEALLRASAQSMFLFCTLMFAVVVGGGFASSVVQQHTHLKAKPWENDSCILSLILFVGGFVGIVYLEFSRARKSGLVCANCDKTFVDKLAKIVLWTGNCPKCKSAVFREDAAAHARIASGLTYEEFKLKFETLKRRDNRRSLVSFAIIFVVMAAFVPLMKYCVDQINGGKLDQILTWTKWAWVGEGIILGLLFLSWISVFWFLFLRPRQLKSSELCCPECSRSLLRSGGWVALKKGICIYCGCHLFEAPSVKPNPPLRR
jgi:hypothetical protein